MASLLDAFIKKPKVSNFDVSRTIYTTANQGTLIPSFIRYMVPGETIKIRPSITVRTNPALAPMYGRWEIRVDSFFAPYRLYNRSYRLNENNFEIYDTVHPQMVVPKIELPSGDASIPVESVRTFCFAPGSLMNHLGFPAWFVNRMVSERKFNAYAFLSYFDIYRNYYIDPQRDWFLMLGCYFKDSDPNGTRTKILNISRPVSRIDDLITRASQNFGFSFDVFKVLQEGLNSIGYYAPDSGLLLRTYKPDLFTANLDTSKLNDVYRTNAVTVTNNTITWQQLRFSSKLTRLAEITRMVGGRYSDWLAGVFGQESQKNLDIPQYLGSSVMHFRLNEQTITASTNEATAGDLVGRGSDYKDNFRPIRFTAKEYGVLMTIVSVVPIPAYGFGIDPFLFKLQASDDFNPVLDNIGFQQIPREWFDAVAGGDPFRNGINPDYKQYPLDSSSPVAQVLGSMPAWSEYCTNWDVVRGEFANPQGLSYWVLQRFNQVYTGNAETERFDFPITDLPSSSGGILGSYIRPEMYQYPFSVQTLNAQNFFLELSYDAKTSLPKSKNVMPTLA